MKLSLTSFGLGSIEHHLDPTDLDERFRVASAFLPIHSQLATVAKPSEGLLDRRANGQFHPTLFSVGATDHDHFAVGMFFHPFIQGIIVVLALSKQSPHLTHRLARQPTEQVWDRSGIIHIGGGDQHRQQLAHAKGSSSLNTTHVEDSSMSNLSGNLVDDLHTKLQIDVDENINTYDELLSHHLGACSLRRDPLFAVL